jgi:TRAP-type C4-dicarboxylate transport system substrate-binding protein
MSRLKRRKFVGMKVTFVVMVFCFITGCLIFPAISSAKEINVKMATYLTPSYVDLMAAMQGFVDEVNTKGKGKIKIDFFHSGKLLEVKELIPGLMDGSADIVALPTTFVMGTYPITGVLSLPLLFDSVDHFVSAVKMDSPLYNFLNQDLAKKNLYVIFGPGDTREILWTKKPVRSPDDLKGLKIRAPGVLQAKEIEAYSGAPVTIGSNELYLALQTGVCDGALNSHSSTVARAIQEVVRYGIFPKVPFEFYGGNDLYFRADWLKSLPIDVQTIIMDAGKNYQVTIAKETVRVVVEVYEPALKAAGVEFIYLNDQETEMFRQKVTKVWDFWRSQAGKDADKAIELAKQASLKK